MQQNLEQTLTTRVNEAKKITQRKYFDAFVKTTDDSERLNIGAKMSALDSVVYDLIKAIRGNIE